MRPTSQGLELLLTSAKQSAVDIHEHLDLLRSLASECEHVTEFGVRGANGSTVALMAGQPETLVSYDINPGSFIGNPWALNLMTVAGRTRWQPRVGNTLTMPVIEPTDLLFIDTYHTGNQLQSELVRHADPVANTVRRYLAFHDTVTFGYVGEDGKPPGLRDAIRWFQKCHAFPVWELMEDRKNNNGLVVLKNLRWRG